MFDQEENSCGEEGTEPYVVINSSICHRLNDRVNYVINGTVAFYCIFTLEIEKNIALYALVIH